MSPPAESVFVCATPRSGSTLFCEALSATGVAGRPAEYFEALRGTDLPRQPQEYFDELTPELESLLPRFDQQPAPELARSRRTTSTSPGRAARGRRRTACSRPSSCGATSASSPTACARSATPATATSTCSPALSRGPATSGWSGSARSSRPCRCGPRPDPELARRRDVHGRRPRARLPPRGDRPPRPPPHRAGGPVGDAVRRPGDRAADDRLRGSRRALGGDDAPCAALHRRGRRGRDRAPRPRRCAASPTGAPRAGSSASPAPRRSAARRGDVRGAAEADVAGGAVGRVAVRAATR